MTYELPAQIDLNREEKQLLCRISFSFDRLDRDEVLNILDASYELAKSLIERDAVPVARRKYFTDDDLDEGRSRSPASDFASNGITGGRTGTQLVRHPTGASRNVHWREKDGGDQSRHQSSCVPVSVPMVLT